MSQIILRLEVFRYRFISRHFCTRNWIRRRHPMRLVILKIVNLDRHSKRSELQLISAYCDIIVDWKIDRINER